jgi:hypothetical protein
VTTIDDTHVKVEVTLKDGPEIGGTKPDKFKPVLLIAGKAYGPTDGIFTKDNDQTFAAIVPTADLVLNPKIGFVSMFVEDGDKDLSCSNFVNLDSFRLPGQVEKFVFLSQSPEIKKQGKVPASRGVKEVPAVEAKHAIATYALLGNNFKEEKLDVIYPPNLKLIRKSDNTALLDIDVTEYGLDENGFKVIITKGSDFPIVLQLPGLPKKPSTATTAAIATATKVREPILLGADQATIVGSGLKDMQVKFGTTALASEMVGDSLVVKGLVLSLVSTSVGSKNLTITDPNNSDSKPITVILDVVRDISETIQAQPH